MKPTTRSPRITHLSWGRLEVEGGLRFKDAKLYPGGAREWDWNDTGTRHAPGIQPSDVAELVDRGCSVVVLARGMLRRLQVCPETLRALERRDVQVHVLPTQQAVATYNELCESQPVGGLIHSTC